MLCLKNHELAFSLSSANQFLQLIGFSFSSYLFDYTAGIFLSLTINFGEGPMFDWKSGFSRMHFRYDAAPGATMIGINLIAIGLLVLIDLSKKKSA